MNRTRFSLLSLFLFIVVDGYNLASVDRHPPVSMMENGILGCIRPGGCPSPTPGHYKCDCENKDVQYDPVCGGDETTYKNQCECYCARMAVAHKGTCAPTSTQSL